MDRSTRVVQGSRSVADRQSGCVHLFHQPCQASPMNDKHSLFWAYITYFLLEQAYKQLRPSLSTIPDEIIEHIAHNLRSDIIGEESYAECYISDNCTDFSDIRFHLSSFSKVCTSV